jgi:hypothetical protein
MTENHRRLAEPQATSTHLEITESDALATSSDQVERRWGTSPGTPPRRRWDPRRMLAKLTVIFTTFIAIGLASAAPASASEWDYYDSQFWYNPYYGSVQMDIYSSSYITGWSLYCFYVEGVFWGCEQNY